jgi:rubredoxin
MNECWRCRECGYVYDPAEGDSESRVTAGTVFELLSPDWRCPVCSDPIYNFEPMV